MVRPCSAPPASYRRLTGESPGRTLKSPTVAVGGEKGFSAKEEARTSDVAASALWTPTRSAKPLAASSSAYSAFLAQIGSNGSASRKREGGGERVADGVNGRGSRMSHEADGVLIRSSDQVESDDIALGGRGKPMGRRGEEPGLAVAEDNHFDDKPFSFSWQRASPQKAGDKSEALGAPPASPPSALFDKRKSSPERNWGIGAGKVEARCDSASPPPARRRRFLDDSRESILDDSRRESDEELGDEYRFSSPVVNRSPSLISGSPSAASILRSSSRSSSPNLVCSSTRATSKGVGFVVSGRNWGKGGKGGDSGCGIGNGERGGASISPKTQKMLKALQDSSHVHTHNCHKVVLRAYLESDARESELADVIGVINLKTRQAEDTPLRGETLLLAQDKLSSNKGRLPGTKAAMRASRSPSSRTFFIHAVDERNAESWMLEVVLQIARSAQSDLVKWYEERLEMLRREVRGQKELVAELTQQHAQDKEKHAKDNKQHAKDKEHLVAKLEEVRRELEHQAYTRRCELEDEAYKRRQLQELHRKMENRLENVYGWKNFSNFVFETDTLRLVKQHGFDALYAHRLRRRSLARTAARIFCRSVDRMLASVVEDWRRRTRLMALRHTCMASSRRAHLALVMAAWLTRLDGGWQPALAAAHLARTGCKRTAHGAFDRIPSAVFSRAARSNGETLGGEDSMSPSRSLVLISEVLKQGGGLALECSSYLKSRATALLFKVGTCVGKQQDTLHGMERNSRQRTRRNCVVIYCLWRVHVAFNKCMSFRGSKYQRALRACGRLNVSAPLTLGRIHLAVTQCMALRAAKYQRMLTFWRQHTARQGVLRGLYLGMVTRRGVGICRRVLAYLAATNLGTQALLARKRKRERALCLASLHHWCYIGRRTSAARQARQKAQHMRLRVAFRRQSEILHHLWNRSIATRAAFTAWRQRRRIRAQDVWWQRLRGECGERKRLRHAAARLRLTILTRRAERAVHGWSYEAAAARFLGTQGIRASRLHANFLLRAGHRQWQRRWVRQAQRRSVVYLLTRNHATRLRSICLFLWREVCRKQGLARRVRWRRGASLVLDLLYEHAREEVAVRMGTLVLARRCMWAVVERWRSCTRLQAAFALSVLRQCGRARLCGRLREWRMLAAWCCAVRRFCEEASTRSLEAVRRERGSSLGSLKLAGGALKLARTTLSAGLEEAFVAARAELADGATRVWCGDGRRCAAIRALRASLLLLASSWHYWLSWTQGCKAAKRRRLRLRAFHSRTHFWIKMTALKCWQHFAVLDNTALNYSMS